MKSEAPISDERRSLEKDFRPPTDREPSLTQPQKLPWQPAFRARRPEIVEGFVMPGYAGLYYMWPEELSLLSKYVDLTDGGYLEIGSMCGIIAMSLAQKFPDRRFVCVDYFQSGWGTIAGDKQSFLQNLQRLGLKNVTLVEGDSLVEVPKLPQNFGIAFIDGNHAYDYVFQDALNCYRLLNDGGYLLFHDYDYVEDTTRAVHDFIKQTGCVLVEVASSVAAVWKPSDSAVVNKPYLQLELEQIIAGLERKIEHLENDLDWVFQELRSQEAWATAQESRANEVEQVLRAVEGSLGWRVLDVGRRLRNKVAPDGTRRRALYRTMIERLRRRP